MNRIRLALIAPFLSAAAIVAAQNPLRDFLVTRDRAYCLMPARPVGGPGVTKMSWSPDGRFLVLTGSGMMPETGLPGTNLTLAEFRKASDLSEIWLSLYDVGASHSETVWKAPQKFWSLGDVKWLTGEEEAYVVAKGHTVDEEGHEVRTTKVFEINAADSRVRDFYTAARSQTEAAIDIFPSPTRPFAVMSVMVRDAAAQPKPLSLFLIGDPGFTPRPMALESDPGGIHIEWLQDGMRPVAVREMAGAGNSPGITLLLDFLRGSSRETTNPKLYTAPNPRLLNTDMDASGALWLVSSEDKAGVVVSPSADKVALAPDSKAIAYVSQGVAMIRPIVTMPVRDYYALREAADRPLAERRARRCYIFLRNYAKAHGDRFPGSSEDVPGLLKEFSDDSTDFEGLTYLFGGGNRSAIASPPTTVLFSFTTVTGRVYGYADGNIRWETNGLGTTVGL